MAATRWVTRASAAPPGPSDGKVQTKRTVASVLASRRQALGLVGAALLTAFPPVASAGQFKGKRSWNGEVGAGVCELGEEGDECRAAQFAKDEGKLKQDVLSKTGNGSYKAQTGQAASKIDQAYFESSKELISDINALLDMDVFDKARRGATTDVQTNAKAWTAKYAPGGSARMESAQRLYVVVDSLLGYFAQNGFAPVPDPMKNKARADMDTAAGFLTKGK